MPIIVVEGVEIDPAFYDIKEDFLNPYEEDVGPQVGDGDMSLEDQIAELCEAYCLDCEGRKRQVNKLLYHNNQAGWSVKTRCVFFVPDLEKNERTFFGILPFLIARLVEGIGLSLRILPPLGMAGIVSYKTACGADESVRDRRGLVSCPVSAVLAKRAIGLEDQ